MTAEEIRNIREEMTIEQSKKNFLYDIAMALYEIAHQLAVHNERHQLKYHLSQAPSLANLTEETET